MHTLHFLQTYSCPLREKKKLTKDVICEREENHRKQGTLYIERVRMLTYNFFYNFSQLEPQTLLVFGAVRTNDHSMSTFIGFQSDIFSGLELHALKFLNL